MLLCFVFLDGTNSLVDVNFLLDAKSLICLFLNNEVKETQKECQVVITYGSDCSQMLGNYSGEGRGNSIETTPPLQIVDDVTKYCFNATLRSINISINTTIVIEGTINLVNISGGKYTILVLIVLFLDVIVYLPHRSNTIYCCCECSFHPCNYWI